MLASTLSISTLERGARLVLDDLEDLLELLHLVVLGKDHLLARLGHRRLRLRAHAADLDDGVGERVHVARGEDVARLAVDDHLRHAVLVRGDAGLLHGQRLEQHVGQPLLARRWQRDDVAPLEDVEGLLGEVTQGDVRLDAQLRDEVGQHLLVGPFADEQAVDVGQPAVINELLGRLEQERLRLALLVRADAADNEGAVGRRARVALERLDGHLGCALELLGVRAVVDVGDVLRGHAHVLDDEVLGVLSDRDHAALVVRLQGSSVEV
mmetsp:Transcript_15684/g.38879  ORF Transcript_15684/g.38879 Transcript_15684/m.38879 type:complete len:267 (-) Transcript_15684:651-1451(-)